MSLTNPQVRKLKAMAQRLAPVVFVGKAGVTEALLASTVQALDDHELIKVKFVAFQDERKTLAPAIAAQTQSELVWIIGHVAVLYRAHPDPTRRRVLVESRAPASPT